MAELLWSRPTSHGQTVMAEQLLPNNYGRTVMAKQVAVSAQEWLQQSHPDQTSLEEYEAMADEVESHAGSADRRFAGNRRSTFRSHFYFKVSFLFLGLVSTDLPSNVGD